MNTFWTIIVFLLGAWVAWSLFLAIKNWSRTKEMAQMALLAGRTEGVNIRKEIDDKLRKEK